MSGVTSGKSEWQAILISSQRIIAIRKSVMVGSLARLWRMKNIQSYPGGRERRTTAGVVDPKSALLPGRHRFLFLYIILPLVGEECYESKSEDRLYL